MVSRSSGSGVKTDMRLLFYAVVFFVGYLIYKATREALNKPEQMRRKRQDEGITAELVEDPVCHTYCPRNDAVVAHLEGGTYYFCSQECKQRFIEMRKGGHA